MITITKTNDIKTPVVQSVNIGSLPVGSIVQLCGTATPSTYTSEEFDRINKLFVKAIILEQGEFTKVSRFMRHICDDGNMDYTHGMQCIPLTIKSLVLDLTFK